MNCTLFANDEVVISLTDFIQGPTHETYIRAISAMRNDLWKTKTHLKDEYIKKLLITKT